MSKLARNTVDIAVNRFCPPVFSFVLLIFVGLESSELLGWYTVVTVFYFILQTLPFLGLTPYIMREAARRPSEAGRILGGSVFVGFAGAGMLCAGLPIVLEVMRFPGDVRGATWIAAATMFPYIVAYAAELIYVSFHRTRLLGIVPPIENLARVVLSIAALRMGFGIQALFWIVLAGRVAAAASYWLGLRRGVLEGARVNVDRKIVRELLSNSPVFFLNTLLFLVVSRAAFLFLSWFVEPASIAHFSVGYRPLEIGVIGFTAFVGAIYPRFSRSDGAESEGTFAFLALKSLKLVLVGSVLLSVLGFLGAEFFVAVLFPKQFPEAVPLLRILIFALIFTGVRLVTSGMLFSSARPGADLGALAGGSAVHLTLLAWWVPLYGAYGAALAVLLESVAQAGIRLWLVRDSFRPPILAGERVASLMLASASCIAACFLLDYLIAPALLKAAAAIVAGAAYLVALLRAGGVSESDFAFLGVEGLWRRLRLSAVAGVAG